MDTTATPLDCPGMNALASDGETFRVLRRGPNRWLFVAGRPERNDVAAAGDHPDRNVCENLDELDGVVALARLELDKCGTWVTLANRRGFRPIVVRRAGWVDVRGHPDVHGGDDRVGLGPGDAVAFFAAEPSTGDDGRSGEVKTALLERALDVAGEGADQQLRILGANGPSAVLAVPATAAIDSLDRLVEATGIPPGDLVLPGYPLGDTQPDLWKRPPAPPREARVRVEPDPAQVRRLRDLLRRLLASWRIEDAVESDDVLLLATEVTANAIRHARTEAIAAIRYLGDRLRIEVTDRSSVLPQRRSAGTAAESGRGMHLVEALASEWGVDATTVGKRVWFDVPVTPPAG